MRHSSISFQQVELYKPLILDYLNEKPSTQSLYRFSPTLKGTLESVNERQNWPVNRELLSDVISSQYDIDQLSQAHLVQENVQALKAPNTFTVTTGHQLNLFGSTQYFIYKMVDTLLLAQELKHKRPDLNFVPVFWLASEDHDFDEINHIVLEGQRYEWQSHQQGAVGRFDPKPVLDLLNRLEPLFSVEPVTGTYLHQLFKEAYSQPSLSKATRYWVHELFKEYGLVILDGDDLRLKKEFSAVMKKEIESHLTLKEVSSTDQMLMEKGYHSQVHVRDINLFHLGPNFRERIEETNQGFVIHGTDRQLSKEEIFRELDHHPEDFSPNALMRPIYQETILPNVAYVGGAGEIAYWLQLKSAFAAHNVFFPQLVVRNSVVWVPNRLKEKMEKLGLEPTVFFQPKTQLITAYAEDDPNAKVLFELSEQLEQLWSQFHARSNEAFTELRLYAAMFSAEKRHELDKMRQRIRKAVRVKSERELSWIHEIHDTFFPNGIFQERIDSFVPSYMAQGHGYIEKLMAELKPFAHAVIMP